MSASITTTISVKNQASQEIQKIQEQLQKYQQEHDTLARQIEKDNKSLAASEKELANNLDAISNQKKQAIQELQKIQRESTKEINANRKKEIEQLKATLSDETKSLQDRNNARAELIKKDLGVARTYYDELISMEKNKLSELRATNNAIRKENESQLNLKKEMITQLQSDKGKQEIILKEATESIEKHNQARLNSRKQFESEYLNSSFQNKYNESVSRLNKLETEGIITTKEKEKALKNAKATMLEAEKSTSNLTNSVVRHLRQIETLIVSYYMLSSAWKNTFGVGIEVNKIVESNTYGIAALISANTRMVDSQGNSLTAMQKFTKAQEYSKDILAELRKESVKTYATFPQLIEIFQQATGQTLSMGNAFGGTIDEINKNTIKLASRMSNIAGSIGMPMDRVREEIRSMLSGNASTDSLISTMIFGSPSEANKAISEAKKKANGLQDLLDMKFKPFDVLADTKSFSKSVLEIQAAWQNLMGDMLEKSGAFKDITNTFYTMAESIKNNSKDIIESFDSMYNSAGTVLTIAKDIAIAFAAFKILKAFPNPFTLWVAGGMAAFGIFDMLNEQIIKMQHNGKTLEEFYLQQKNIQNEFNSPEKTEARLKKTLDTLEKQKTGLEKALDIYKKQNLETSKIEERLKSVNTEIEKTQKEYKPLFDSSEAKKQLEATKQQAQLMQNLSINQEDIKDWTKQLEDSKGNIFKLEKDRKELVDKLMPLEKKLAEEKQKQVPDLQSIKTLEEAIRLNKDVTLSVDKKITEEKEKQFKKSTQLAETESQRAIRQNKEQAEAKAIEVELAMYKSGNIDLDRLAIEQQQIKVKGLETELQYLEKGKVYNKAELEYLKEKNNLESMRKKEEQKQYSFSNIGKSFEYSDMGNLEDIYAEMTDFYKDDPKSLNGLRNWYEKAKKELEKMDFSIKIKFEGWDEVSNGIASIGNSFQNLNEAQLKFNDASKNREKDPIKWKQAQIDYADATMSSYADMTGAIANFYDEDDDRRKRQLELQKVMHAAKMAMQLVELSQSTAFTSLFVAQEAVKATAAGTTAVAVAAQSSPWTGFATAAAMAALLASFGIMLGGKTKTSTTYDSFSQMAANEGRGSVLGDSDAQSESITKALATLEDYAQPQYTTLLSMNKYLATIANNIVGVTSLLIQQGGFAFGEGYSGFDTGYKNNIALNDITLGLMNPIQSIISKIPVIGQTGDLFGSVVNKVLGGVFGSTKVYQDMTDSGIYFANQLLTNAIEDFNGAAYQTITTTVTKKSWFSKSSSTTVNSYFQALDNETERQFSLVLNNLYNTVIEAGKALDSTTIQTEKALENFVVSIGKISLKGKTGDEIQEALTSIFGKIGDDIAKTAFPLLTDFQKVGEGMFETLTRVATGMEEAGYYIDRLGNKFQDVTYTAIGNKQGNVGFEALLQSIEAVEKATYPTNNNLLQIVKNLELTAEELYATYTTLDELRDRLIFVNKEAQSLSSSMIQGAGGVAELQNGLEAFFENFLTEEEQLSYQTSQLIESFNDLNIALPTSKEGFKNLLSSIDTTTESGQKLYGSLIILSEEFANVSNSMEESIKLAEESLQSQNDTLKDVLYGVVRIGNTFLDITDSLEDAINTLKGNLSGSDSLDAKIKEYWNKREEVDKLVAKGADISTSESERLKTLTSELGVLATNVQTESKNNSSITQSLIDDLSQLNSKIDFSNQVLQVSVVDGLGDLLGLTEEQLNQLKEVAKDGEITSSELSSISNLTEEQKNGIIEFANVSNSLSTEDTLSSLNEYAKKQLEVLQQTQAEETAKLSAKTLSYGDYIGKQEQIDIAKLLGVSYDTAKPLIEQIQALSVSKNPSADLEKILGYAEGSTSFNQTIASQLQSLSPYVSGVNIAGTISSVKEKTQANLEAQKKAQAFANAKADFEARYSAAFSAYSKEKNESDVAKKQYMSVPYTYLRAGYKIPQEEDIANGKPLYRGVNGKDVFMYPIDWQIQYADTQAKYRKEFAQTASAYDAVETLLKEKQLKGYAVGTTEIPYDQIAQIHKGEMILPQTFADGVRKGEIYIGSNDKNKDNNAIIEAIDKLETRLANIEASSNKTSKVLNEAQLGVRPIITKAQ